MKCMRLFPIAALALAACGGSADPFVANAPTFDKLAVSQNDGDMAAPVALSPEVPATTAVTVVSCHPHLFERSGEVIHRVNRHFFKLIHHVEELIENSPKAAASQTRTWENVKSGIDRKLTMTSVLNADGSTTYNFELDVASAGANPSFVKVMSGSLTHSGPAEPDMTATARVENKGTISFDYSALASVDTTERSRGQITDAFDNVHDPAHGVKRTASITLTNFLPEEGDPHGPRTGSYSWEREPGVGGKFQFQDSVILLCPDNPSNLAAEVTAVARWYKASDGGVHGRSDAKATGGQIASGYTWMGVTCAKGQTTSSPAEGFWMMKEETAAGATVSGQADTTGAAPCDPVFGPVPNVGDNTSDYNFAAAVSFPGEW